MDPVRNPYQPGAGLMPPALVGRDREIHAFEVALKRMEIGRGDRSLILVGMRGVGKTVLLREFAERAKGRNWVCHDIESEGLGFVEKMAITVRASLLRLSALRKLSDRVLGVLKSFQIRWNLPNGGDVSLNVEPQFGIADSGSLARDLTSLFLEVGKAARERQTGVLITVDEVQFLPKEDLAALISGLHRVSQETAPLLVVGAGLPSIYRKAGDAKPFAERLFRFLPINSLDDPLAEEALVRPAKSEGVTWTDQAVRSVLGRTQGHPYFLQEYGRHTWDVAPGPDTITRDDVERAIPFVESELDSGFFQVRIDRATSRERDFLKSMARLGSGPVKTAAIASEANMTQGSAQNHRRALIEKGLCYATGRGELDFTVPMFDAFVRRSLS